MILWELKKILTGKIALLLIMALGINLFIFYYTESLETQENPYFTPQNYRSVFAEMENLNTSERVSFLKNKIDVIQEKINDPETGYDENLYDERDFLNELYEEALFIQNYEDFLTDSEGNALKKTSVSIFGEKGSFAYNNALKMAEDFQSLHGTPVSFDKTHGITSATGLFTGDIITVFILLLIVGELLIKEHQQGIMPVIRTTKKGRKQVILAKIFAVFIMCFVLSLIFLSVNLLYSAVVYGLGDLSRPVQSLPGFAASTIKITIWQYFILLWIVKAFAFFIVASIAIVFSVIFANGIAAYGLTGIILAVNYVLYFVIPVTSPIAQLHFLNLGNFLSGTSLFCGEVNLNIFSVPMDVLTISLIIMAVLALVLPIISVLIFVKSKKEKGKLKILSRLPSPHRKKYSSGIFSYECFKLFVSNGAIIIFAVFIAVQFLSYPKKDTLTAYEQCEISYMETLKGEYTEEKLNYLQSEYEENAALSNDNFTARTKAYSIESKLLPLAYHLQELEAHGENAEFVPYSGYSYLFNPDSKTASASACFLILFIAISVTSLFPMEKSTGMNQILTTTLKGKGKTVSTKVKTCLMLSVIMCILAFAPDFIYCLKMYGFESLMSESQNLMVLSESFISLPIIVYMIILYLIRLLGVISLTVIILGISSLLKSQIISVLLNLAIFGAPAILSMIDFKILDNFSMVSILSANKLFFNNLQLILSLLGIIILTVLGVVLLKKSQKTC